MSNAPTMNHPTNGSTEGPGYEKGINAIRLAHNLETQAMIAKQSEHNEQLRQAANREAFPSLPTTTGGEADMGSRLAIDSPTTTTINHYHPTQSTEATASSNGKGAGRKLARLALVAGLLGAGASIPFVASVAANFLRPAPIAPAPVKTEEPEKPTAPVDRSKLKYSLDLGE